MVRRAVKPVPTPKWILPGASWLSVPNAEATTGAIRLLGIDTPVASWMRDVSWAAIAITEYTSAHNSCVS